MMKNKEEQISVLAICFVEMTNCADRTGGDEQRINRAPLDQPNKR
jgi:hypothetical protein